MKLNLVRGPRFGAMVVACIVALSLGASVEAGAVVTYEAANRIFVQDDGWDIGRATPITGQAPALSPSKDTIAFLRNGNLYLISGKSGSAVQLTRNEPLDTQETNEFWDLRISWDSSGRWLVYTRALPYKYDRGRNSLVLMRGNTKPSQNVTLMTTIWIADSKTRRSSLILGPRGDYKKMSATYQLEGAAVYEPMFSPNGKSVWFLNGGYLYEVGVELSGLKAVGKPRLVAKIGKGLDFGSSSASKWGTGAQQIAWDSRNSRLCYWIGRFWGSGESGYGYIPWSKGKWGHPTNWQPDFSSQIRKDLVNVQGCVFDDRGWMWTYALIGNDFQWVRRDGRYRLSPNVERPDWGSQFPKPP